MILGIDDMEVFVGGYSYVFYLFAFDDDTFSGVTPDSVSDTLIYTFVDFLLLGDDSDVDTPPIVFEFELLASVVLFSFSSNGMAVIFAVADFSSCSFSHTEDEES